MKRKENVTKANTRVLTGATTNKVRAPKVVAQVKQHAAQGGIWDEETKSYTFAEDQHIEIDGEYIDVSGMEVPLDKNCEYSSAAIKCLLKEIKPEAKGVEIVPFYLKQNFPEEANNLQNAEIIQDQIKEIIDRKRQSALPQIGSDDDATTILIPYSHVALSQGRPSDHWSLLALKFTRNFTECEPYSITTSGDNAVSAEDVNEGIRKAIPTGIEVDEAINIVTMQQNSVTAGSSPTVDCGSYLIQNAENIAALGLEAATFQIDKTQKKAEQPIEGQDVNLRGISLRARQASIIALKDDVKSQVAEMVGGESAAANLAAELRRRIALKRQKEVTVETPSVMPPDGTLQVEVSASGSDPKSAPAEILKTKLSEVTSAENSIFFHLGNLGNSTEELKVQTATAEIVVKREENARARPIITPQLISLHQAKSQHRAEFGGVVFDETSVRKNDDGKNQEAGIFNNADLQSANFRGCKFDNVDFSSIDPKVLGTISFTNCEFQGCNFPKDFKFQQYQFKFKQTDKFDVNDLTAERGDKKIPKGIPADKFEDEPAKSVQTRMAEKLRANVNVRE
ncbi:MAG: pentapeptide repeat-containing protein [Pseudomonadota bacterium]